MKLSRDFIFDAAHHLGYYPPGHANTRIHGHSFRARITVAGQPGENGQIVDFATLDKHIARLREMLDHNLLNDISGLETPTLENICLWMWQQLEADLPQISVVEVFRDSLGQSCLYQGNQSARQNEQ